VVAKHMCLWGRGRLVVFGGEKKKVALAGSNSGEERKKVRKVRAPGGTKDEKKNMIILNDVIVWNPDGEKLKRT